MSDKEFYDIFRELGIPITPDEWLDYFFPKYPKNKYSTKTKRTYK